MPLEGYSIVVTLPVLWGNQDLFGHVNNCVYSRWFESSRVAYWDEGMRFTMESNGWGPILVNLNVNFKRQIRYPDTVQIGARVSRVGKTSMTMEHAVFSDKQNEIAADGHSIIVMFNYESQRPTRITDALLAAIRETEGRDVPRD